MEFFTSSGSLLFFRKSKRVFSTFNGYVSFHLVLANVILHQWHNLCWDLIVSPCILE